MNIKPIKIKVVNECWEVISHASDADGYPRICRNGNQQAMHRYIYQVLVGDIPKENVVRHTCDNNQCINPDHLVLGTQTDNIRDRVERGRSARGEKNGRAKLTEEQARKIKKDSKTPKLHLAKRYGVNSKTISDIQNGNIWKHI